MRCTLGPEDGRGEEWECSYCSAANYQWRTQCYKCLVPRSTSRAQAAKGKVPSKDDTTVEATTLPEVDKLAPSVFDPSHDVSPSPSRFLLLQFLKREARPEQVSFPHICRSSIDINSSPSTQIFTSLQSPQISPQRVWLATDRQTKASLAFAFAQFSTIKDASEVLRLNASEGGERKGNNDTSAVEGGLDQVFERTTGHLSFGRDLYALNT